MQSMTNVPSLLDHNIIFKKIKEYEQLLLNVSKSEYAKSAEVRQLKTAVMNLLDYTKDSMISQ